MRLSLPVRCVWSAVAVLVLAGAAVRAAEKKELEAVVDKALKAYNDQDHKAFYADFAKSMAAIATEQAFNSLYVGMYMKQFGKYESKTALEKETVLTGDFPLLVYEAKFEKGKVKVSVNFTKEDNAFKVMQVRFDEIK